MAGVQTVPAWLLRRRTRRLDHRHDDRVVRWIGHQPNKTVATESTRRLDDGSNDNVVHLKQWVAN